VVSPLLVEILSSIVVCLVVFALFRFFAFLIEDVGTRAGAAPGALRTARDTLTLISIFLAVLGVLSATGLASEITTLTLSGIIGLVVSLSLQSTLSNIISGITLLYDKAIRLGDDIEFQGVRGKVVQITLRNTWMKTQTGEIVVVGNSTLSGGPLVNFTAPQRLKDF
jgi:small-conductance mechanosensitive channel